MSELIRNQLINLNIRNNIIEILVSLLQNNGNINNIYTTTLEDGAIIELLDILFELSTNQITNQIENKTQIIKVLKYYLKASQPNQNCYFLINNIIDNLNGSLKSDDFDITFSDIDNDYIWLLYYLSYLF